MGKSDHQNVKCYGEQRPVTVIIGAGPAGLTAAYELIKRHRNRPIILEASRHVGGIARTVEYKGNRIDLGGHRYFSKSERITDWWINLLPLERQAITENWANHRRAPGTLNASSRANGNRDIQRQSAPDPEREDAVMLVRKRRSQILFGGRLFQYPVVLDWATLANLGCWRATKIVGSYIVARLRPIHPELSLRDFLTNRFGSELYRTFFRDYTEKVWGISCQELKPDWGTQRIKGLSMRTVISHAAGQMMSPVFSSGRKNNELSLIDQFYYPKLGSGQIWAEAARAIERQGGKIHLEQKVTAIQISGSRVYQVESIDTRTGEKRFWLCDQLFSSMPVKDLVCAAIPAGPAAVLDVAARLPYRDFITVGILAENLRLPHSVTAPGAQNPVLDQWIYLQEPGLKAGRLQIYNNWSPYMVADPNRIWIGLEYFCNEGDAFWGKSDETLAAYAVEEMVRIGALDRGGVLDSVVLRVPKAYPAYHGSYEQFAIVKDWADGISNLFLIGRNGTHHYNNMDHSMLTAMAAVECAGNGGGDKRRIWAINNEPDYHEI